MNDVVAGLALAERREAHGRVRLVLVDHSAGVRVDACELTIDPFELNDGRGGVLHVDGIGNVQTLPSHRRRGLASALLEVAIERMRAGGADGSLLYGIDGFYGPMGWRSCGDERWVHVPLDAIVPVADGRERVRVMRSGDLDAVRALHERLAPATPGAVTRPDAGRVWSHLDPADALVVERDGELGGWAWRGRDALAERDAVAERHPDASVWAELHAVDEDAMHVLLAAACERARSAADEPARHELMTGAPERHALRRLARSGALTCRLVDEVRPSGGAMLLPFSAAGEAALASGELYQFLPDRF